MIVIEPSTPTGVVAAICRRIGERAGHVTVAIDGAPAADPDRLAEQVVAALNGRPSLHVRADRFWRQASLRLEHGRTNPDAWLDDWLDTGALQREVLERFAAGGQALPGLRDPATDRPLRAEPVDLGPTGVVVVSGSALLGRWLSVDLSIHVHLSASALARRTNADQAWQLPGVGRYEQESAPDELADLVVRADDPLRPALVLRS